MIYNSKLGLNPAYVRDDPEMSTAYGFRTRVTGVRGQRPRPLDERGRYA